MTPSREEILRTLCVGFLLLCIGVTWRYESVGLIVCGSIVLLVGVLLGFLDPRENKED